MTGGPATPPTVITDPMAQLEQGICPAPFRAQGRPADSRLPGTLGQSPGSACSGPACVSSRFPDQSPGLRRCLSHTDLPSVSESAPCAPHSTPGLCWCSALFLEPFVFCSLAPSHLPTRPQSRCHFTEASSEPTGRWCSHRTWDRPTLCSFRYLFIAGTCPHTFSNVKILP